MSKDRRKQLESLILQLEYICASDNAALSKIKKVEEEFYKIIEVSSIIKEERQARLNKVLHSTRALDTSLRTLLEHFRVPYGNTPALGPYVNAICNDRTGCFKQMDGNFITRIKTKIIEKRNLYMHTSGAYPNKNETEMLLHDIITHFHSILVNIRTHTTP